MQYVFLSAVFVQTRTEDYKNTGVLVDNKDTFVLQFQSRDIALDAILCEKGTSLVYIPVFP